MLRLTVDEDGERRPQRGLEGVVAGPALVDGAQIASGQSGDQRRDAGAGAVGARLLLVPRCGI